LHTKSISPFSNLIENIFKTYSYNQLPTELDRPSNKDSSADSVPARESFPLQAELKHSIPYSISVYEVESGNE
jgi:hypothetical protein